MTEMFGEAWSPMSVPDLAPDDDDDTSLMKTIVRPLPLETANTIPKSGDLPFNNYKDVLVA